MPSVLRNMRTVAASFMPDDTESAGAFALVGKWLADAEVVELLQPEAIDACVREVAVMASDFEDRCSGHERSTKTKVEWMLAVLAALTLGSRNEPTEHFDNLWELAPRVLGPLVSAGCELRQLDQIATALSELAFARDSYAVHRAAIRVTRELVERTADPTYRRDLAFRLAMFGLLCTGEDEFERAGELLAEALDLSTALANEDESEANLRELGRALDGLETLSRRADALDQAADYRARRQAVLERLVLISDGGVWADELAELKETMESSDGDTAQVELLH